MTGGLAPLAAAGGLAALVLAADASPAPALPVALPGQTPDSGSIVTRAADAPTRNVVTIYEDAAFRFRSRHAGDGRAPGGATEPGLFVQSRATGRWRRIVAIATAGGRFGHSDVHDSAGRNLLRLASVGWDFRPLAERAWAEQPLRTSGSLVFPDSIHLDPATDRYVLHYLSRWGIPEAETVLSVRRSDLVAAFGRD
jgi:hypothetical protein